MISTTGPSSTASGPSGTAPEIVLDGTRVDIRHLSVDDPVLADLLGAHDDSRRIDEVVRVLQVGARGITAMGAGLTVTEVGEQVGRALVDTTREAQTRVDAVIDAGRKVLAETLDPDVRASLAARMLERVGEVHGRLLGALDPASTVSHTGRFLGELRGYLAADGELDARLAAALDPAVADGPMAKMLGSITGEIRRLRDDLMREAGRAEESTRGTRKGFDFEDTVEDLLRVHARGFGGLVERTSSEPGCLGPGAVVGDLVVTLPGGERIAVEVKRTKRIGLTGSGGILEELDRAMANRDAGHAICVSASDAFPAEVGLFGVYGNRVLVVDDGDGEMLAVALRWSREALAAARTTGEALDVDLVTDRLTRIKDFAARFSSTKRALAQVRTSIDGVRNDLDAMRTGLLELVDEALEELRPAHGDPVRGVA
jgi:hypothetical protein